MPPKKTKQPEIMEISWEISGQQIKRHWSFYVFGSLISLLFLLYALLKRDYLFAFLIFLFIITYFLIEKREKENLKIQLTKDQLTINQKDYPLSNFSSFTIERGQNPQLILKSKNFLNLSLSLKLKSDEELINQIEKLILESGLEEKSLNTWLDKIFNKIK